MKAINRGNGFSRKLNHILTARALIVAGLLFCAISGLAQPLPGGKLYPSYTPLDSWSFNDTTNWTSGLGYAPVSFTNITGLSWFGDGTSSD